MRQEKYNTSILTLCPTCGGQTFKREDDIDNIPVECTGCNRKLSIDELISENDGAIQEELQKVKKRITADLKASLLKQFKNSKYIRIK